MINRIRNIVFLLRDIAWPSVFSVIFLIVCLFNAVVSPGALGTIIGFGLSSMACAYLSQRV